jgi:hypothetical protein
VNDSPSLGFSALHKSAQQPGRFDKLRRLAVLLVALIVMGTVFYYLTRAVQTSTAHATGPSGLHSD